MKIMTFQFKDFLQVLLLQTEIQLQLFNAENGLMIINVHKLDHKMAIYYPNAYEEGIPTTHYNCHSYAWYNPDKDMNKYWINYPNEYINDSSYDEVENPRVGDILSYW